MNLKLSLILGVTLTLLATIGWELYWRGQGYVPTLDDNKDLWAVQRDKVDDLKEHDVILTGSSRVLFDIQLDAFEEVTGIRPLQLAFVGSSPLPIFHDIVETTDYKGTIIVGVTPGLFFSTTFPKASPWSRPQAKVDHYHKRTYAQRANHVLSLPLQQNLVLMSGHEEEGDENIDLKNLLRQIDLGDRVGEPRYPTFFEFGTIDLERNMRMTNQCATDTAFANVIKNAWKFILTSDLPPPDVEGVTNFFVTDAKKFQERGGNLILISCPSTGMFRDGETHFFPKEKLFNNLLELTGAKGYHYEDYPELVALDCPEWSHLSAEGADYFTTFLAREMIKDKAIQPQK